MINKNNNTMKTLEDYKKASSEIICIYNFNPKYLEGVQFTFPNKEVKDFFMSNKGGAINMIKNNPQGYNYKLK
tara:strand:+ start:679 stop:897 length:219 start_codon:yes stop_codon:yes gene_type:complete